MINGAGDQGGLVYSGAKILFLVEDGHTHWSTEAKLRDGRLKILPASGSMPERQRSEGALSRGERAGRRHSPSPPSAQLITTCKASSQTLHLTCLWPNPVQALPCTPTHPAPLTKQQFNFADWQVEDGQHFPSFPNPPSAQLVKGI